ncbi:MAG: hypothetical protein L3J02_05065 [Henriciella sp.]|nr:hypothetical protein [Henriciella sp.]
MQATSSHVTATPNTPPSSAFMANLDDQPGTEILAALTHAATVSKRAHILVRRRQRATRRKVR